RQWLRDHDAVTVSDDVYAGLQAEYLNDIRSEFAEFYPAEAGGQAGASESGQARDRWRARAGEVTALHAQRLHDILPLAGALRGLTVRIHGIEENLDSAGIVRHLRTLPPQQRAKVVIDLGTGRWTAWQMDHLVDYLKRESVSGPVLVLPKDSLAGAPRTAA